MAKWTLDVDLQVVEDSLNAALDNRLQKPKIHINGLTIYPSNRNSTNPDYLYIKYEGNYVGKYKDKVFHPSGQCLPHETQQAKNAIEGIGGMSKEEFLQLAIEEGKRTGICCCCGRKLTNPASVEAGIGPICVQRYGF